MDVGLGGRERMEERKRRRRRLGKRAQDLR